MMKIMKTSAWSMIFWAAAYMTAMGGAGHAWANIDECSVTTVNHTSADCLTADITNNGLHLSVANACTLTGSSGVLGKVVAEVSVSNWNLDQPGGGTVNGTLVYLRTLTTSTPFGSSIRNSSDSEYIGVGCCPADGICANTDCDTTDGVINDSAHASHCYLINDDGTLGTVYSDTEILNGQLVNASSD